MNPYSATLHMQYILKTLIRLICISIPFISTGQSTLLPIGSKFDHTVERIEIFHRDINELNYSTFKPIGRELAVKVAEAADSLNIAFPYDYYYHLSAVDKANIQSLLKNNMEWVSHYSDNFRSRKPLGNAIYKDKANFFITNEKNFFLAINPVIQEQQSIESASGERVFLNSKGATIRGLIGRSVGFDVYVTDNQERGPEFFRERVIKYDAVPGVGFYKHFKSTAYDYIDSRGSIYFKAAKYFNFQFGYDKNFIGDGYRSLFLSDFGNSYLFLRVNTRIWKISYNNLYMELVPQTINISSGDKVLDKKYLTIHHLSFNATPWLNIGFFDAVVFGRKNRYELSYLNPIIFLRGAEQQNGSGDNALIGFNVKVNAGHQGQVYGQLLLDEFVLKEARARHGWWGNKFGYQMGGKYFDAFEIHNFDVQVEINMVRPFTYSHFDSVTNYSHYNQPLAHPLGANFIEGITIFRYQPKPKWTCQAKFIFWRQGLDSANLNFGSDIFKLNATRNNGLPDNDHGYTLSGGVKSVGLNMSAVISYEWKENLFIDAGLLFRRLKVEALSGESTIMATLGIRLNMFRREYDY